MIISYGLREKKHNFFYGHESDKSNNQIKSLNSSGHLKIWKLLYDFIHLRMKTQRQF